MCVKYFDSFLACERYMCSLLFAEAISSILEIMRESYVELCRKQIYEAGVCKEVWCGDTIMGVM